MEFLIFSDSHGASRSMEEVLARQVRSPDAILFLGDGLRDLGRAELFGSSVFAVRGNCDWTSKSPDGSEVPNECLLQWEGHRLLLTHGHLYQVKYGYGALIAHAATVGAELVLFGHTHVPLDERVCAGETVGGVRLERTVHLFNPGSLGQDGSFGCLSLRGETVLFSHGRL